MSTNYNYLLSSSEWRFQNLTREDFLNPETYSMARIPCTQAHTPNPEIYTNQLFFNLEQEKLFAKSWVVAATISDIPDIGDVFVTKVAGQSIIITRDAENQLHAFYNVCRHRGTQLFSESKKEVKAILCPYHSWGYKLNGECIGAPMFEKSVNSASLEQFDSNHIEHFNKDELSLISVDIAQWGFLIFINLNADCSSLEEQLGDIMTDLKDYDLDEWEIVNQKDYHINSNWKLLLENAIEYYHLPSVHPKLTKTSRLENHHRWQGKGWYCGLATYPLTQTDDSDWLAMLPYPKLNEKDINSGYYYILLPNIVCFIMPSHAFVIQVNPISMGKTYERTWLLSHPECTKESSQENIDAVMNFWDEINMEDAGIVEKVFQGLSTNAYKGGRVCYHFEEPVHRFQNLIIDKILGIDRIPPSSKDLPKNFMLDFSQNNFGL